MSVIGIDIDKIKGLYSHLHSHHPFPQSIPIEINFSFLYSHMVVVCKSIAIPGNMGISFLRIICSIPIKLMLNSTADSISSMRPVGDWRIPPPALTKRKETSLGGRIVTSLPSPPYSIQELI